MQTKLVNEVQLPTTVEHLGREKILLEGDQGKSLTDGDTQGVHPQSKTPSVAPTHQAAGQNRSLPNGAAGKGGLVPSPQGRAGEEVGGGGIPDTDLKRLSGKGKGPSKSGGRSEASANPFKGFVQPGAEVPPTHELQKQVNLQKYNVINYDALVKISVARMNRQGRDTRVVGNASLSLQFNSNRI